MLRLLRPVTLRRGAELHNELRGNGGNLVTMAIVRVIFKYDILTQLGAIGNIFLLAAESFKAG